MQPGAERTAATFDCLTRVVAEPMRFKAKLAIGEDAYGSLRATRALSDLWQVTGAATAAGAAGWGVIHLLRRYEGSRVQKVPRFITTPLDLLGASLFDMIAALALLMAREADQIDEAERHAIKDYFVTEWGLDPIYADRALPVIEAGLKGASVEGIARALAEFKRDNPDCNYEAMTAEVIAFLTEIAGADGQVTEHDLPTPARDQLAAMVAETGREMRTQLVVPVSTQDPDWNLQLLETLLSGQTAEALMVQRNRRRLEGSSRMPPPHRTPPRHGRGRTARAAGAEKVGRVRGAGLRQATLD